jgi:hypothetical protein
MLFNLLFIFRLQSFQLLVKCLIEYYLNFDQSESKIKNSDDCNRIKHQPSPYLDLSKLKQKKTNSSS